MEAAFSRRPLSIHPITPPPARPPSLPPDVPPKVQVTATAEGSLKTMQDYKIGFGAVLG